MEFKLVLIEGFFGQRLPTSKSMDVTAIIGHFKNAGHTCETIDIQDLQFEEIDKNDAVYLFGSHQNPEIKKYINDVASVQFSLHQNKSIPGLMNLLAHENKGIQSLLMRKMGDGFIPQCYYYRDVAVTERTVIKKTSGAGSFGVALIDNSEQLVKTKRRMFFPETRVEHLKFHIREITKKLFFKNKISADHYKYFKSYSLYVLQKFIPGLKGDYKVLAFGNKFYVLNRKVRRDDFRASGSGNFSFDTPSATLLDFAETIKSKVNTPIVSMDLIDNDAGYGCIEYQCVHFGPYTQFEAEYYYEKNGQGEWVRFDNNITLEELYVESICQYVNK
ncbi:hypothetical protein [Pseudomonas graminis]